MGADKVAGIDITNDEGLPKVRIERATILKGTQFFVVKSDRQAFDFYVTAKGYIHVGASKPRRL